MEDKRNKLRGENKDLQNKIETLQDELDILKTFFITQAGKL